MFFFFQTHSLIVLNVEKGNYFNIFIWIPACVRGITSIVGRSGKILCARDCTNRREPTWKTRAGNTEFVLCRGMTSTGKKNDASSLEGHMQSAHRLCTGGQTDVNEACCLLAQIWKHNRGMNIWIILVQEQGCQSCYCSPINSFWIQFDTLRKYTNMDLTLYSSPAFLQCYAIGLFFTYHSYNSLSLFYFCFVCPCCEN